MATATPNQIENLINMKLKLMENKVSGKSLNFKIAFISHELMFITSLLQRNKTELQTAGVLNRIVDKLERHNNTLIMLKAEQKRMTAERFEQIKTEFNKDNKSAVEIRHDNFEDLKSRVKVALGEDVKSPNPSSDVTDRNAKFTDLKERVRSALSESEKSSLNIVNTSGGKRSRDNSADENAIESNPEKRSRTDSRQDQMMSKIQKLEELQNAKLGKGKLSPEMDEKINNMLDDIRKEYGVKDKPEPSPTNRRSRL